MYFVLPAVLQPTVSRQLLRCSVMQRAQQLQVRHWKQQHWLDTYPRCVAAVVDFGADSRLAAVLGERGVSRALLRAAMRSRAPLSAVCVLPPLAVSSRPCLVLPLHRCPYLSPTTSSMRLLFIREDVKDIKVVVNYDM
jgi:hypothetical protein